MKPSSRDQQLGLASPLNYAAIQNGKIKNPSKKEEMEAGGWMQAHTAFREGRGENFLLDILFHRMSEWILSLEPERRRTDGSSRRHENLGSPWSSV